MSEPSALVKHWADFVEGIAICPPTAYVQIRKMVNNVVWEVPYDIFETGFNMSAETLQYASWKSKFAQLDRNYFNQEEFEKCNQHFLSRVKKPQTCVTARFGNQEKKKDSMGFCMQTISLNYLRKTVDGKPLFIVEIYYRSTEVAQKFAADLNYLHQRVLPIILKDIPVKPDLVRFKFNTMYLSSMFLPILFQYKDPVSVVEGIIKGDEQWYTGTVSISLKRWFEDENPYNWRTQLKQWENFDQNVKPNLTRQQIRKLKRLARK